MSPLKLAGPAVTVKVPVTLSPGATGPGMVTVEPSAPATVEDHPAGRPSVSFTFVTGAPVVFVNVTRLFWLAPGEKVCRPGGPAATAAAVRTVPSLWLPDESSTVGP